MSYNSLPSPERLAKTVEAVKARGIQVEVVENKTAALEKLKSLIPAGAPVMTGSSTTLAEIGFEDLLISGKHPWRNVKGEILAEKDPQKQAELRKQSVLTDYFLGSVHAVAETGELVIGSASGSQLPSYTFTSQNVIWVVGAQKLTASLADALQRVREYVVPLEDKRMKSVGVPGTMLAKLLIVEGEAAFMQRKVTLVLVKEPLGF